MLEITRYNPFTGDDTDEAYRIESLPELVNLPFVANAISNGWEVFEQDSFIYIKLKGSTLRVASMKLLPKQGD